MGRVTSSESNNQRSDYKLSDSSGGSILAREYINVSLTDINIYSVGFGRILFSYSWTTGRLDSELSSADRFEKYQIHQKSWKNQILSLCRIASLLLCLSLPRLSRVCVYSQRLPGTLFIFGQDEDIEQPPLISEGSYVRVYGTLKSFQGSPHVVISRISEIKDPNEITMHLLEMTHTYLRMKNVSLSVCCL